LDERGIDSGGLTSEFFEIVGRLMKTHKYKFFIANSKD